MTPAPVPASTPAPQPTRRPARPVKLLIPVPGTSTIHELWAGTKLLVVLGISALLTLFPDWLTIGVMAVLVLTAARMAHIPRGALPSMPRWLWIVIALGGISAALGGGKPEISIVGLQLGLGGGLHFLRFTALSIVLLALGGMVSWTTNVAEIGPAVATLGRPLRILRIPVDEWAVALALALRAFPMLIDEFHVLNAARQLRPKRVPHTRKARRHRYALELIDLLAAAIYTTLRRADEMGDAITARGGTGQLSAKPARLKLADWVTLAIVAVASGAAVTIETLMHWSR
ncbi:MAG: energy-coupling factor transporter transmembrane protein EcfT [Mycobacterium sp.]